VGGREEHRANEVGPRRELVGGADELHGAALEEVAPVGDAASEVE
jgi:hypothetical protein